MHRGFFGPGLGLQRIGSSFDPLTSVSSANLFAWWDCSDETTISVSSGSLVSQLDDKSGNGYDLTETDTADQGDTGTDTQNGLNVIYFDRFESIRIHGSYATGLPASFSVYGVAEIEQQTSAGQCIWGIRDTSDGFALAAGDASDYYQHLDDSGGVGGDLNPSSVDRKTASTRGYTINDSTSERRIIYQGSEIASDTNYNGAVGSTWIWAMNGRPGGSTSPALVPIYLFQAELLIYDAILSAADEAALITYLQGKWAVT